MLESQSCSFGIIVITLFVDIDLFPFKINEIGDKLQHSKTGKTYSLFVSGILKRSCRVNVERVVVLQSKISLDSNSNVFFNGRLTLFHLAFLFSFRNRAYSLLS